MDIFTWLVLGFGILFIVGTITFPLFKLLYMKMKIKKLEAIVDSKEKEFISSIDEIDEQLKKMNLKQSVGYLIHITSKGAPGWIIIKIHDEIYKIHDVPIDSEEEFYLKFMKAKAYYKYKKYRSERKDELENAIKVIMELENHPIIKEKENLLIDYESLRKHIEIDIANLKKGD